MASPSEKEALVRRGFRKHRQIETIEAVRPKLEQNAGENYRARGGRLDMSIGKPGVEWKHWHLNREAQSESEEQKHLQRTHVQNGANRLHIENAEVAGAVLGRLLQRGRDHRARFGVAGEQIERRLRDLSS